MTVTEFHRAAVAALAAEPDESILIGLCKQAQELSDMVGWADGIIDKEGRVSEAFIQLQAQARTQHEATGDQHVAIFHDALSGLLSAIYTHDEDLTPSSNGGDDGVDI